MYIGLIFTVYVQRVYIVHSIYIIHIYIVRRAPNLQKHGIHEKVMLCTSRFTVSLTPRLNL